jgi:hypothetical protein
MHCADSRRMFARQLSGEQREDDYWSEGPEEAGTWKFKECQGKQEVLDSLRAARQELQPFLDLPASSLTAVLQPTLESFDKMVAQLKEQGKDTSEIEARGPANVVRVMMALVAHESGHRASLQTLLRLQGVNAPQE